MALCVLGAWWDRRPAQLFVRTGLVLVVWGLRVCTLILGHGQTMPSCLAGRECTVLVLSLICDHCVLMGHPLIERLCLQAAGPGTVPEDSSVTVSETLLMLELNTGSCRATAIRTGGVCSAGEFYEFIGLRCDAAVTRAVLRWLRVSVIKCGHPVSEASAFQTPVPDLWGPEVGLDSAGLRVGTSSSLMSG